MNGKLATTGDGPWTSDVALSEGENTIEYSIVSGSEVFRGSIHVTYRPPK